MAGNPTVCAGFVKRRCQQHLSRACRASFPPVRPPPVALPSCALPSIAGPCAGRQVPARPTSLLPLDNHSVIHASAHLVQPADNGRMRSLAPCWIAWLVLLSLPLQGMAIALQRSPVAAHHHLPLLVLDAAKQATLALHTLVHLHERDRVHEQRSGRSVARLVDAGHPHQAIDRHHHHEAGTPGVVYLAADGEDEVPAQPPSTRAVADLAPCTARVAATAITAAASVFPDAGSAATCSQVVSPLERPPRDVAGR